MINESMPSLFSVDEYKKNFKPNKKIKKKEEKVQLQVCNYLNKAYPRVIFTCDLSSGMKLPIHIAAKNKKMRSSRGLPDLFIAKKTSRYSEPTKGDKPHRYFTEYGGLFIELKNEDTVVYNKDGSLRKDPHLHEQNAILESLREEGYMAVFACGFSQAKKIIDEYMCEK